MSDHYWDAITYAIGAITMIPESIDTFIVFYGDQIYDLNYHWRDAHLLPEGSVLYIKTKPDSSCWYRKDFTPLLISDVPESNKAWILLMGV